MTRQIFGIRSSGLLFAFAACHFIGCGAGGGVKVEGNLVKDGQPYVPQAGENLSLSFNGKNAEGAPAVYPGIVDGSNGSFVVKAADGSGLPPGVYKIRLSIVGGSDTASMAKAVQNNKQFAAINSKEVEIVAGDAGKKIIIDIAKGTITK